MHITFTTVLSFTDDNDTTYHAGDSQQIAGAALNLMPLPTATGKNIYRDVWWWRRGGRNEYEKQLNINNNIFRCCESTREGCCADGKATSDGVKSNLHLTPGRRATPLTFSPRQREAAAAVLQQQHCSFGSSGAISSSIEASNKNPTRLIVGSLQIRHIYIYIYIYIYKIYNIYIYI